MLKWTNEHGNQMKDPAYQVWILKPDFTEFARWGSNRVYEAEAFLAWLEEKAKEWAAVKGAEAAGPKIEFRDDFAKESENGELRFEEIDKARSRGERPILIYFQQPGAPSALASRGRVEEIRASREFEKGVLSSDAVIKLSRSFECFRIDLSKEADKRLAKRLGIESAPSVLLWSVRKEDGVSSPTLLRRPAEKVLLEALRALVGEEQGS